ncbi:YeaH/YhbH family protein [Leeia oryzae]|uniref:YeaH/YhbH family protein n=1 Tax=Leeia oryzae TaxID=356662 RepID=UPI00037F07CB|nr:YeaH/YhbH family protein [Leeia oryzae]
MSYLIDRRLNGRHRSAVNRERFLRRYRQQIKDAVNDAIKGRSITDIDNGENVSIPVKDLSEPTFTHGHGGVWERVHPGNEEYIKGDKFNRPQGGSGQGSGNKASNEGEGEDAFQFQLSREEFLNFLFDDLALPNLVKTQLASMEEMKPVRAGFATDGTPTNIHVIRSLKQAMGRRLTLGGPLRSQLHELEAQLAEDQENPECALMEAEQKGIEQKIHLLKKKLAHLPFLDPLDLRYSNRTMQPRPSSKAVMFCIMDVSGSMDESRKEMAKRFFILLYLFLQRVYEKIELVFIRHHTQATEVDEENFFHSRETGGTVVSSALKLMQQIMEERYSQAEWNIYAAQASDGDNWDNDSPACRQLLDEKILPLVQYFAYIEITDGPEQNLWHEYVKLTEKHAFFAMQKIREPADIYPVFRKLFQKKHA